MVLPIQVEHFAFDEMMTIDEATSLLNRYLTKMQEDKKCILATRLGNKRNEFFVEYRMGE